VRDTYAVAVDPYSADVPLVLSVAVAVDTIVHDEHQRDRR
jgi:uncharacterized protein YxjI